jgi:hypothetical protein
VAGGGPVLSQLAALASLAADWEEQAAALLGRRGSLEELAALQRVAEGIPAKLPSLKQVTAAQAAARAWGERAHPYLRSKQSRRHTKGQQPKGPLLQVSTRRRHRTSPASQPRRGTGACMTATHAPRPP